MLVIDKNYDKKRLVTEWGFENKEIFNIYSIMIDEGKDYECKILIEDGIVNFFYFDETYECIDYTVKIPNIIFDMIKEGIILKI